jgi:hypothetical protein
MELLMSNELHHVISHSPSLSGQRLGDVGVAGTLGSKICGE